MAKNLIDLTERDIQFLKNLDGELRYTETIENFHPTYDLKKEFISENFHDRKITNKEVLRILGISKKNNTVFYPSMTQFGFATAFEMSKVDIINPGVEPAVELLLKFRESQLPNGYDFDRLSSYFLEKMNLRTAKVAGIEIKADKVHYIY